VATLAPLEHCLVCYIYYSDLSNNCFISIGHHPSKGKRKADDDGSKEKAPRTKKPKISKTPPSNVTVIDLDPDEEILSTTASTLSVPLPPNTLPALASSSSSVPSTSKSTTTTPVSICGPEVLLSTSEPSQGESREVTVTKPSTSPSLLIVSVPDVILPAMASGSDLDGSSTTTTATASDSVVDGIHPLKPTINQGRSEHLPGPVEASTSNENRSRIQRVSYSLKSVVAC
jgi:hypothetical protein